MMFAEEKQARALVLELQLLLPQSDVSAPDPASSSFCRIVGGLTVEPEQRVNRHQEAIVAPLGEWAARHGLAQEAEVAERLEQVRFNMLVAQTYPRAPYEEFLLAAKWCTWLFFHDDWLCDRQASSADGIVTPDELRVAHQSLLEVLGGRAPGPCDPLELSLHEIAVEALRWGGNGWIERFRYNVRCHFVGNEKEAEYRQRGQVPTVSEYIKMRPLSGAVYTAFDFIELVEDLDIGPALRSHVLFRKLALLANNCICWLNDLYSLAKEIFEGNPNNLVLALRQERGLDLAEAMSLAVEMHNREYGEFEALEGELTERGLVLDRDLRAYLRGIRSWIQGNAAWSRQTLRYQDLLNMTL